MIKERSAKWWLYLPLTSFVGSWYLVLLLVQKGLLEVTAPKEALSAAWEIA